MQTWIERLFGLNRPPAPKLVAVVNRMDGLEERYEYLAGEMKRLRGRVTGSERHEKTSQDAPPEEIPSAVAPQHPPLARRLRAF